MWYYYTPEGLIECVTPALAWDDPSYDNIQEIIIPSIYKGEIPENSHIYNIVEEIIQQGILAKVIEYGIPKYPYTW